MTGNKYALDTNIVIAWLDNESIIADKITAAMATFIPIIVVGELYYGVQYSTKVNSNLQSISRVLSNYSVLLIDENVCKQYGVIKTLLRKKGKPIPENDVWIAAIAMENNLILATRDNHFKEVEELELAKW